MARVLVSDVIAAAARLGLVNRSDLLGPSRVRSLAHQRQRAMYAAKLLRPEISLPKIGQAFGGRDHTTVIYALQRVEERMRADPAERAKVQAIIDVFALEGAA